MAITRRMILAAASIRIRNIPLGGDEPEPAPGDQRITSTADTRVTSTGDVRVTA